MKRKTALREARHRERLEIAGKIARLEALGNDNFYLDVEPDPPGHPLTPDEVDYLCKKPGNRIKTLLCRLVIAIAQPIFRRSFRLRLVGEENLSGIRGGAILTSNHFGKFENLAVKEVADRVPGRHRFYRVIKGGNYFLPGFIGFLMKHCDTLPLSTNLRTTRLFGDALETILQKDGLVLIYPEQAMWWNYRKPRPPKPGAYFYAAKFGVPVIPCFVTMEDQEHLDGAGFPRQSYTVHILPPLYPDPEKPLRENERGMKEENYRLCREVYAAAYGSEPDFPTPAAERPNP